MVNEESSKKKAFWSKEEAILHLQRYCAAQERCHQEVRHKLIENGVYGDILEEVISELICSNFLDEERFAKTYARGKFRMKQWERNKIKYALKLKDVSSYSIQESMKEINDDDYLRTLQEILEKKETLTKFKSSYERVKKLTDYAMSRGFEYHLIQEVLHYDT